MKQFKGTPGNFTSQLFEICSGDVFVEVLDDDGCSVASCGQGEIAEHNARLFAAAPKLLKVLQMALPHVRNQATVDTAAFYVLEEMYGAVTEALGE